MEKIDLYLPNAFWVTIIDENEEVIEIEKATIAESFEKYWWWFLQAIWVALRRADSNNTEILLEAFDFYVKEYIEKFILPNQK